MHYLELLLPNLQLYSLHQIYGIVISSILHILVTFKQSSKILKQHKAWRSLKNLTNITKGMAYIYFKFQLICQKNCNDCFFWSYSLHSTSKFLMIYRLLLPKLVSEVTLYVITAHLKANYLNTKELLLHPK